MSNVEHRLAVETAPLQRVPGMATTLAFIAIVLATLKLGRLVLSVPGLIGAYLSQGLFDEGMSAEVDERMRGVLDAQMSYLGWQVVLIPLGFIVAAALIWGAISVLRLTRHADLRMRWGLLAAAVLGLAVTAVDIQLLRSITQSMSSFYVDSMPEELRVEPSRAAQIAVQSAFFASLVWSIGILLLQFGYYVFSYRYFSRPEIRALY